MTDPDFLKRVREMARKKQAALGGLGSGGPGGAGQGEAAHGAAGHETVGQFGQASGSMMGEPSFEPCCEGTVHIAYRGVSDDKMYISHDRKFSEIKYFRPNGLRVFCADCRRRLN